MVIEWLDKYYLYFAILLLLIAVIKILGASPFLRFEDGFPGMIIMLFRWFSATDYHVCDAPWQIKNMRLLNKISFLFYCALIFFVIITVMIKLFR